MYRFITVKLYQNQNKWGLGKLEWEKLPIDLPEELDEIELVIYPIDSVDDFHS